MKKKKLTNKDLDKYAEISNIPVEHLVSLNNMDALNVVNIHAILIKNEYKKLLDENKYTGKQIMEALGEQYGISRYHVETIIYDKIKPTSCVCSKCGSEISKYKFSKNKGVCDKCIVAEINGTIKYKNINYKKERRKCEC